MRLLLVVPAVARNPCACSLLNQRHGLRRCAPEWTEVEVEKPSSGPVHPAWIGASFLGLLAASWLFRQFPQLDVQTSRFFYVSGSFPFEKSGMASLVPTLVHDGLNVSFLLFSIIGLVRIARKRLTPDSRRALSVHPAVRCPRRGPDHQRDPEGPLGQGAPDPDDAVRRHQASSACHGRFPTSARATAPSSVATCRSPSAPWRPRCAAAAGRCGCLYRSDLASWSPSCASPPARIFSAIA